MTDARIFLDTLHVIIAFYVTVTYIAPPLCLTFIVRFRLFINRFMLVFCTVGSSGFTFMRHKIAKPEEPRQGWGSW